MTPCLLLPLHPNSLYWCCIFHPLISIAVRKASPSGGKPNQQAPNTSKKKKRDRGSSEEQVSPSRSATPESSQDLKTISSPPTKKHKSEFSPSIITEEEVIMYLKRRPIASKDLLRKFINKKTAMERPKIVEVLHEIIKGLENVQKQLVKEKLYLSLSSTD